MKSIKQILSEANTTIYLSENPEKWKELDDQRRRARWDNALNIGHGHIPGPGNMTDFSNQLNQAKERYDDNWIDRERFKQTQQFIQGILNKVDAQGPLQASDLTLDMNNTGQLPQMDLGMDLDLNVPEVEPEGDGGWGFGSNDPYYFKSIRY
tara:strand:+ start:583 stop:1038 length:456 start_codon:yes stop_codon:yes gene_type:complete